MKLVEEEQFNIEKEFDMENNYEILISKRIEKVDNREKELYLKALEGESEKYPKLYKSIIEKYEIK